MTRRARATLTGRGWHVIGVVVIAAAAWLGYRWYDQPRLPKLPAHADPLVAAQIEAAASAVERARRSGPGWGRLGMVLHAYLFNEEARICFAHAQRYDGAEARWPYFEGMILLEQEPDKALRALARAVELCPATPDTPRLQYARALLQHGQSAAAESQFRELLARNGAHTPAWLGLARIHHARGQGQEALEHLKACLDSPYTARHAHMLMSAVQSKHGRPNEAAQTSQRAATLPADRSWPEPFTDEVLQLRAGLDQLVRQAEAALKENRLAEAERALQRLVDEYSTSPQTLLLQGRLLLEKKQCSAAEAVLRRHRQAEPDSVNGSAQLGMALLCQERYAEAIPFFEKAVKLKPDFAESHFNLGFARARAGQGPSAVNAFWDAIRCSPTFLEPYLTLADLLGQMGQTDEALILLERARQIDPGDPRPKTLLERTLSRAKSAE